MLHSNISPNQVMKECFEKKDIGLLQKVVTEMPKEDAEYHIKRCVDSGLWVPGGAEDASQGGDSGEAQGEGEQEEEEVYDDPE